MPTTATGYGRMGENKEAETEWLHGELMDACTTVLRKGGIRNRIRSYCYWVSMRPCCIRCAAWYLLPLVPNSAINPWPVRIPCSAQGLKFRRNFAEIRRKISFSLVTGKKNFGIFRKISVWNSKFKKFRIEFTEIRRNPPKFRNEISFPLNTGICNENEMVNPGGVSLQKHRGLN